jgi:hypothetical protein
MLRKMLIGFAIPFLLLVGAGGYLYLEVQPILYEAEARQEMLQPRPIKGEGNFARRTFYTGESLGESCLGMAALPKEHGERLLDLGVLSSPSNKSRINTEYVQRPLKLDPATLSWSSRVYIPIKWQECVLTTTQTLLPGPSWRASRAASVK